MVNDFIPAGKAPQNVAGWSFNINNSSLDQLLGKDSRFLVIDYSKDGSEAQRYSVNDIAALHQKGKTAVSYLSIGEAEDYRYYYQSSWNTTPPSWLGKDNPDWPGNTKVKYWDPEWQQIMQGYLDKIIESGFDGIYLDIVDGYDYWSNPNNGEGLVLDRADAANRMIDFVEKLTEYARVQKGKPDFYVIPQNGEELLKYDTDGSFLRTISAVGVEDLYYNETSSQSAESIAYRRGNLDKVVADGKPVLVIDYVNDGTGYQGNNKLRIDSFWQQTTQAGYTPQISSIDRTLLIYDPLNATLSNIAGQRASSVVATPTPEPDVIPAPVVATPTPQPETFVISPVNSFYSPVIAEKQFGGSGSDKIYSGNGNDYIAGNLGNDVIDGGAGNDIIYGEWDRDLVNGGEGNDLLWGNDDDDTLFGGSGDDRLTGDRGYDVLTGGAGRDIFVYENFAPQTLSRDTITDLEVGVDKIELRRNIFSALGAGSSLNPEEFATVDYWFEAATSKALIVYDTRSGELYYNANGTEKGLGEGTTLAVLSNRPNLSASDFLVVD